MFASVLSLSLYVCVVRAEQRALRAGLAVCREGEGPRELVYADPQVPHACATLLCKPLPSEVSRQFIF